MRFTKILLVCLGLATYAGLCGNLGWTAAGSVNQHSKTTLSADGGEPLPPPPLVADGGEPLPPPPLTAV